MLFASAADARPIGLPPLDTSAVPQARRAVIDARIEAARTAGFEQLVVSRFVGQPSDPEAVWCLRGVRGVLGERLFECVDARGGVLDVDTAWRSYYEQRHARVGVATDQLAAHLETVTADAPVEAIAWARRPADLPSREAPDLAATDVAWNTATDAIVEACEALAAERDEVCITDRLAGAPFVSLTAPPATIRALARHRSVGAIEHDEPEGRVAIPQADGDDFLRSARFHIAQGYAPPMSGAGSTIAVFEGGMIQSASLGAFNGRLDWFNDVYCLSGFSQPHADSVLSVVSSDPTFGTTNNGGPRSLEGGAPASRLLLANYGNVTGNVGHCVSSATQVNCNPTCGQRAGIHATYTWAVGRGADVFQDAVGWTSTEVYPWPDRYMDWHANNSSFASVVTVSGQSTCAAGPGPSFHTCYNCLVVGAADDQDDSVRFNDAAGANVCTLNRAGGLEVPHVSAVGGRNRLLGFPSNGGQWSATPAGTVSTSWASPQVAALAGVLIGEIPALAGYPEAVRALIMASATRDTDGTPLVVGDTVDDADGAGLINAGVAARIAREGELNLWNNPAGDFAGVNYGFFNQTSDFISGGYYADVVYFNPRFGDVTAQVTLAWNAFVTCSDPTDTTTLCPTATNPTSPAAYSIEVYDDLSAPPVATSAVMQWDHNYVHVRFPVSSSTTYVVLIRRIWQNPSPPAGLQYFGLAWTTFNSLEE